MTQLSTTINLIWPRRCHCLNGFDYKSGSKLGPPSRSAFFRPRSLQGSETMSSGSTISCRNAPGRRSSSLPGRSEKCRASAGSASTRYSRRANSGFPVPPSAAGAGPGASSADPRRQKITSKVSRSASARRIAQGAWKDTFSWVSRTSSSSRPTPWKENPVSSSGKNSCIRPPSSAIRRSRESTSQMVMRSGVQRNSRGSSKGGRSVLCIAVEEEAAGVHPARWARQRSSQARP
mmetsp:Transcript_5493/g.11354  ORF Transcript_5493/g.11354 Transcript_5493/m.11354 type:complete len:234 (-) Transcript_5493:187-888(-)